MQRRFVVTCADVQKLRSDTPLVVQFSAPWCRRSPAFTDAVRRLGDECHFLWACAQIPEAAELVVRYGIRNLPAIAVYSSADDDAMVVQGATVEVMELVVRSRCQVAQTC